MRFRCQRRPLAAAARPAVACVAAALAGLLLLASSSVVGARAAGPPLPVTRPAARPAQGARPCAPAGPAERISVDFREAPLADVARLVSCAAELNLLFAPASLGKKAVTVVAPRPVGRAELLALWQAVLADEGLEMTRRGGYWLVAPVTRP